MRGIAAIILLLLFLALASIAQAQPFVPIPAEQILLESPPPPTPTVTASYTGANGNRTLFYWVIANYAGGVSPTQNPARLTSTAPLGGGNRVDLTWSRPQGVQSFDVVRTETPTLGTCTNCLLASGITVTNFTDTGGSIGGFTVTNPLTTSRAVITINNRDRANPFVTISGAPGTTLRQVPLIQGSFVVGEAAVFDVNGNLISSPIPPDEVDPGAANDLTCYTSATNVRPCDTGTAFYNASLLTIPDVAVTNLTNGRIPFTSGGQLTDDAGFTWDGNQIGTTALGNSGGLLVGNVSYGSVSASAAGVYAGPSLSLHIFGTSGLFVNPAANLIWRNGAASNPKYGTIRVDTDNQMKFFTGDTVSEAKVRIGGAQTFLVQDETATTGVTDARFQAGAGQGSTPISSWLDNAGNPLSAKQSDGSDLLREYAFANLPAALDRTIVYCNDCTRGGACAGGGTGALAVRINGAWECL